MSRNSHTVFHCLVWWRCTTEWLQSTKQKELMRVRCRGRRRENAAASETGKGGRTWAKSKGRSTLLDAVEIISSGDWGLRMPSCLPLSKPTKAWGRLQLILRWLSLTLLLFLSLSFRSPQQLKVSIHIFISYRNLTLDCPWLKQIVSSNGHFTSFAIAVVFAFQGSSEPLCKLVLCVMQCATPPPLTALS